MKIGSKRVPPELAEAMVRHLLEENAAMLKALRLALPAIAMHTKAGALFWPSFTPKTETGEPDLERIASLVNVAIANAEREP